MKYYNNYQRLYHLKKTIDKTISIIPPKTLPTMIAIWLISLTFYEIQVASIASSIVAFPIPTSPQQAALQAD